MRILIVHNAYQQAGGEDSVVANEAELLRSAGYEVELLLENNDRISGPFGAVKAALGATYSPSGRRKVAEALDRFRPDVMHVHNFFPLLSPAIFDAAKERGVRTVWTLHNFRVACANGLLFRDGKPCEDCVGTSAWPAVRHGCYRGSRAGSAAVALSIETHRRTGTWYDKVDCFIALNEFCRERFIAAGLPAGKIKVKANFTHDPGPPRPWSQRNGATYVGRLSPEKGVRTLIEAWRGIETSLTIIGEGPEMESLKAFAPANVEFIGYKNRIEVYAAVASAAMIIVPSIWYENCPMTIIEAMSLGTPVIASRRGALKDIVEDGVSGFQFCAGDADDLQRVVNHTLTNHLTLRSAGIAARRAYERRFSPESSLEQLRLIYTA